MGKLFYIMGKSASGKDHIYAALLENRLLPLKRLVLYTTRPRREGEENGREYFFTDEKGLEAFRKEGKVIESRVYQTIHGPWTYFTADDGQMDLDTYDYLGIGTLESFVRLKEYYGEDRICPIYIEVEDGERLQRALKRERKEEHPKYEEMCRRFLADQKDFSEENILASGIWRRFSNVDLKECIDEIILYIRSLR